MKTEIPSFDKLADTKFDGMFFKDEGSYLEVKFQQDKQPAVDGMYEFGSLQSAFIKRSHLKSIKTRDELKSFLTSQLK